MADESEICVRKSFAFREKEVLSAVLRRPSFPKDEAIDGFFASCVSRLLRSAEKGVPNAARRFARNGGKRLSLQSKYRVTFETADYVSVLFDVTAFDGVIGRTRRFSSVWERRDGRLLTAEDLFLTGRMADRALFSAVRDAIEEAKNRGCVTQIGRIRNVPRENVCLVPRGIAFCFPPSVFLDGEGGLPLIVVPKEQTKAFLRIDPWSDPDRTAL